MRCLSNPPELCQRFDGPTSSHTLLGSFGICAISWPPVGCTLVSITITVAAIVTPTATASTVPMLFVHPGQARTLLRAAEADATGFKPFSLAAHAQLGTWVRRGPTSNRWRGRTSLRYALLRMGGDDEEVHTLILANLRDCRHAIPLLHASSRWEDGV